MVELGDAEELETHGRATAVASEQHGRGCQSTARALPTDADAVDVEPELVGARVQPRERGIAVLDTGGERVLGSQAVLDGGHRDAELTRQRQRRSCAPSRWTDDEAATMDVEQRRSTAFGLRSLRCIEPDEYLGCTVWSRRLVVLTGAVIGSRQAKSAEGGVYTWAYR